MSNIKEIPAVKTETLYLVDEKKNTTTVRMREGVVISVSTRSGDPEVFKTLCMSLDEIQKFASEKGWMVTIV